MTKYSVKDLLNSTDFNREVTIQGWVRTKRGGKEIAFIAVNDGSTIHNIQVVASIASFSEELLKKVTTGASVSIKGTLVKSQGQGQAVEIQAKGIEVYGTADETFPLQKKGHTLEFLREIAHLRPRTNTFGAVLRIRHALSFAIHSYFNNHGFFYLHAPVITAADAEGAGEMFRVTTLDLKNLPLNPDGSINFKEDFFGKPAYLTVSGQLEGELAALALSKVYTFGPTFRAENSNTPRHLAEFWMIEPEMAFYDIHDNMNLAEDLLKYVIGYALDKCGDDIRFLNDMYDKELLNRLHHAIKEPFQRMTYTEAIEVLKASDKKFEFRPEWGSDLQKEHENFLVDHFGKPVILTDYPKDIKAFYMKLNDDGKTVRAMDILFHYAGEIIGGSQREENYDTLLRRMKEMNVPAEEMKWYLDTRKYGSVPHSGFGLGLERLLQFTTGMTNVRDVIPFPRTPKNAEF
ncbi:MAG: asparagine--tRNA ligase [Bacteroidia bacterium]|nr:asparagine--tRNA ligase [Bacteroidia bacterium]